MYRSGAFDEVLIESDAAALRNLLEEKHRALSLLEEQQHGEDDMLEVERRIVGQCLKLAERLGALDFEGKRAMFAALGLKVEATREDVSVTVVLDPKFTTTERTLASQHGRSRRCQWA